MKVIIFDKYGSAQVSQGICMVCPFILNFLCLYIQELKFNTAVNVRVFSITFSAQEISLFVLGDIGYCFKLTTIIKYYFEPSQQ